MKKYEYSVHVSGRAVVSVIFARNADEATRMVRAQYPGCSINYVKAID